MSSDSEEIRVVRARLAYRIIVWGAAIVVGATLLMLLDQPFELTLDLAKQETTSQEATNGLTYVEMAWGAIPFVILAYAGFGIMVRAWVEQRAA